MSVFGLLQIVQKHLSTQNPIISDSLRHLSDVPTCATSQHDTAQTHDNNQKDLTGHNMHVFFVRFLFQAITG